jgi:hypothetical protein
MKMRWLTQIPSMVLVVMLTLVVVQGLMFGPVAQSEGGGKLEGTWLMESTLVNCATGDPLPIPGNPFPSLHTYMRGGTALDSGASPPPLSGGYAHCCSRYMGTYGRSDLSRALPQLQF